MNKTNSQNVEASNGKYLHMANEIKSATKLGFDRVYVQFANSLVSIEPFEGRDNIIELDRITWLCQDTALDLDSDELLDRIVAELEIMDTTA